MVRAHRCYLCKLGNGGPFCAASGTEILIDVTVHSRSTRSDRLGGCSCEATRPDVITVIRKEYVHLHFFEIRYRGLGSIMISRIIIIIIIEIILCEFIHCYSFIKRINQRKYCI